MAKPESKAARRIIAGLSALVVILVTVVLYLVPHAGANGSNGGGPDGLATVNACLNGGSAVLLTVGFVFIKRKNVAMHRLAMSSAFTLSSAFLVTYLVHHARVGSVPYRGTGALRALYFGILVPHVVLAAVIVPMALLTIYRGFIGDISRHRPLARRTLPLWLYVSVSGVVLYFLLYGTETR
jgi:putative membrane protein